MPELPEVETIRRQLEPELVGRGLVAGDSHPSGKFTPALDALGAQVERIDRRGKYLLIGLDDDRELIVHLGMTGGLHFRSADEADDDPYVRAWWELDDGRRLEYRDVRRFGRLRVVPTGDYRTVPTLAVQGPDVLDEAFTGPQLYAAVKRSNRRIKTQLLSQRPVGGVGNIYADEALWRSRIHPGARTISRRKATALRDAIYAVITGSIGRGGTTLRDYRTVTGDSGDNQHHLDCYGRGGEPCGRCGDALRSVVYDARTTTFCPTCQHR